jgi:hypothetical protein
MACGIQQRHIASTLQKTLTQVTKRACFVNGGIRTDGGSQAFDILMGGRWGTTLTLSGGSGHLAVPVTN